MGGVIEACRKASGKDTKVTWVPADFLQASAIIVVAFGYVLGGANVLRVNFDGIYKKQPAWQYKIVLVISIKNDSSSPRFHSANSSAS